MLKQKFIINICTYKRPQMLKSCLQSILIQSIPSSWSVEVQIIDNDTDSQLAQEIKSWEIHNPNQVTINYFIEPNRGIPMARNAALKHSLENSADWILFIDDDEIAAENWLQAYAESLLAFEADAYTGPVQYNFPDDSAEWLENKSVNAHKNGVYLKRASTNNVLFSKKVISRDGFNLSFDNNMALMGGEDSDFFLRLIAMKGKIVFVKNAVVIEDVLPNRAKLFWRLNRQFRSSTHRIYTQKKLYGTQHTVVLAVKESLRHFIDGTLGLITSPFFLLLGKNKFKKRYYHALRHYSKLLGNIIGLVSHQFNAYKITDGY